MIYTLNQIIVTYNWDKIDFKKYSFGTNLTDISKVYQ